MRRRVHPLIASFLDVRTALDVMSRDANGVALTADEQRYATAARAHPDLADEVKTAAGKRPSPDAQNATILLGVRAALSSIEADKDLAPHAANARTALIKAGANSDQIEQLLGGVLVEEAFTGEQDPTEFDSDFVKESLDDLPQLAQLDGDKVGELIDAFANQTPAEKRAVSLACAETLFHSAWGEGPQSVNVEHLDEALEILTADTPSELEAARPQMEVLLRFLSAHKLVGPLRLERLLLHLKSWEPPSDEEFDDELDEDADLDDEDEPAN
jgi:hypothetical protein